MGCGEQRIELGIGEERDKRLVKALGGDRENPLDCGGVLGVLERGVFEQRADRREPGVASPDAVRAVVLEVVEKRADQRGVEVVYLQQAGLLGGVLRGEREQHPQRVAVGSDRVRAGFSLVDQSVGEERLQRRCEQTHRAPSSKRSSRSAASASSSGAACRYQ